MHSETFPCFGEEPRRFLVSFLFAVRAVPFLFTRAKERKIINYIQNEECIWRISATFLNLRLCIPSLS